MKTKRKTLAAAIALAVFLTALPAASFAGTSVHVDIGARISVESRDDLQIWIWPDRGEGAEYFPGDHIWMNVEVTRDCFLILYDIDTRGNLSILYPYDPWDDNFVAAGEVVSFPRVQDGYDWTVDGPQGIEYIQAIASEFPIDPPDWPVYMRSVNHGGVICHDPDLRDFRAGDDHLDYMQIVNRKITGRFWDYCATDIASFYVSRPYQPVYNHPRPWPEIYYGDIYIGWPIGGRIYIDGVYMGIAPLWIPRYVHFGSHVIVCRDRGRVIRQQSIKYHAKRDYRHNEPRYKDGKVKDHGQVKIAKRGGREVFKDKVRVHEKDRITRAPRKKYPDRVKTRDESPRVERGKVETKGSVIKSRTKVETRGEVTKSRTKVEVKRETSKSTVKNSRRTKAASEPVSKPGRSEVTRKKSGGLGGFISSVAKSVSKVASKGDTKSASKSAPSVKSKKTKAKSSASTVKKVAVQKSTKRTGKKR